MEYKKKEEKQDRIGEVIRRHSLELATQLNRGGRLSSVTTGTHWMALSLLIVRFTGNCNTLKSCQCIHYLSSVITHCKHLNGLPSLLFLT